ncbi:dynamin-2 [Trichonephila inaurata madagascariensis]|uniref:Dynamin-2 n=1 Tax=Trichonephila inaurata madagascariensis TaxID=2747483 RepID=A0A8X6XWB6_9ARAC|nr:dynamin-2 [Trichonephila inaurata madagascariensis]
MGTPYLQRMLQKTLRSHIKAALPDLRNKLAEKLSGYNKKLKEFSIKMGEESGGKQYYMVKLVNTFIEDVSLKLLGNSEMVDMRSISAGAYINYKLNTEVQDNLRLRSLSFPSLFSPDFERKLGTSTNIRWSNQWNDQESSGKKDFRIL